MIVLDASALLAFMFREAGHEEVAREIDASCISTVNLSEVLARFARDGHSVEEVLGALRRTSIEFVEFSLEQARIAAEIAPVGKEIGLSLGDRACLALGITRRKTVMTADRVWKAIPFPVEIRVIR